MKPIPRVTNPIMKPERWEKLNSLFHAALALEPAERAAYLSEACILCISVVVLLNHSLNYRAPREHRGYTENRN